jgi:hypothetical protein
MFSRYFLKDFSHQNKKQVGKILEMREELPKVLFGNNLFPEIF